MINIKLYDVSPMLHTQIIYGLLQIITRIRIQWAYYIQHEKIRVLNCNHNTLIADYHHHHHNLENTYSIKDDDIELNMELIIRSHILSKYRIKFTQL